VKQREKVILIIAFAAVVYAVYALFLSGSPQPSYSSPEGQLETARTFASDMSTAMIKDDTSSADTYVITKAATEWAREPFLVSEKPIKSRTVQAETDEESHEVPFLFTGYLRAGDKTLAVINGMEYEIGETLDPGGFTVRNISRTQVFIENSLDGTTTVLSMDETSHTP
jgi:hypothetical protein